jgi:hypothetical protein
MATKQTITPLVLRTEALRVSKNHVRRILREKGIREGSFKASELTAMARRWFDLHRSELVGQALGSLAWAQLRFSFQKLKLMERHAKAQSADVSAIQKSAIQKEAV